MQPSFRLYRESYDAAIKANDAFAARFYLNLFPPAERVLIWAEPIVANPLTRLLLHDDVIAALKAQPAPDPEIHDACLKLAETWAESAEDCNNAAWPLVSKPGQPDANYERGLRLARAACRLEPKDGYYLVALGVAQYRCGLLNEALATLTRSNDLHQGKQPAVVAILALTQHRLGQADTARATLRRLREVGAGRWTVCVPGNVESSSKTASRRAPRSRTSKNCKAPAWPRIAQRIGAATKPTVAPGFARPSRQDPPPLLAEGGNRDHESSPC